ncbi:hypothetical protein [Mycobacteroides abscessus]|uniref:hypothetical protein n=1 Tax=Mycobacteroides abscessus TaxID=36809 RepID=UPI0009A742A3|nr:hypothetical protein [Mycobacteroides abscessus]SKH87947.1 Protein of uncharacterised function (DUF2580) [Mycobacteroides abscessus subsp. massiliense]SKH92009.1 Protein of uncharacterised function (DUF2580) [Mycobacteroides abscessus subsp. massiliense]SKI12589.1 Protein of uncharacterised function (DUF2580) [Mycobacteroides abscessus subsp. massiliense]SKK21705.1 Protein of uncharacterised function (DUF2580) [Mycobacteroides abscessus subsp. massiliense]SKK31484.1 Protein of uncharacteris
MADLTVETDELHKRAATIQAVGEDHVANGALDEAGVESTIDAFGEINALLHDDWRGAKAAQSRAWIESGQAHGRHADKVSRNAYGYEGQDTTSAQNLRVTD